MKNKLLCTLSAALFTTIFLSSADASDLPYKQIHVSSNIAFFTSSNARPPSCKADVIIYKTRIINGVRQYRRWNETKQCWVDPYWINA